MRPRKVSRYRQCFAVRGAFIPRWTVERSEGLILQGAAPTRNRHSRAVIRLSRKGQLKQRDITSLCTSLTSYTSTDDLSLLVRAQLSVRDDAC